jgi:hypothetical protein
MRPERLEDLIHKYLEGFETEKDEKEELQRPVLFIVYIKL